MAYTPEIVRKVDEMFQKADEAFRKIPRLRSSPKRGEPVYYHGGPGGLNVGSAVLPPAITGVEKLNAISHDTVYVTTVFEKAVFYCAGRGLRLSGNIGKVYRVEPVGTLVDDPDDLDATPPNAFFCSSARVLQVITPSAEVILRVLTPHLPSIGQHALLTPGGLGVSLRLALKLAIHARADDRQHTQASARG